MSTFVVLPPRECLEQAAAEFVCRLMPGIAAPATLWETLLDHVASASVDTYFVHREDLPREGHLADDLAAGYGAESGDEVIEVGLSLGAAPARLRRWVVTPAVSEPGAGR